MNTYNDVALDMAKFLLEMEIIFFSFCYIPLESLIFSTLFISIGLSFLLHRKCVFIKELFFELVVKVTNGTFNRLFSPTNNDVRSPSLSDFLFEVGLLFLWKNDFTTDTTLLVCLVLLVIVKDCMAFFQEVDEGL